MMVLFYTHFIVILLFITKLVYGRNTTIENQHVEPQGKIVGGIPVSFKKFPSTVLFLNLGAQCAGTIINSWTVLTAAHCFDINKDKENMEVEVGKWLSYQS